MIPFKTQYVYMCFSRMVRFLTLSHIFYQDSSIYDFNHILFYTMSGIFILLPTFLLRAGANNIFQMGDEILQQFACLRQIATKQCIDQ